MVVGWSKALEPAALEAAGSSSRGGGLAAQRASLCIRDTFEIHSRAELPRGEPLVSS